MRCLVTGCAGFIGSHLSDALLAQGHEVVGVDAFTDAYDRGSKARNVQEAGAQARFRLIESDLADADLPPLLEGADIVFHLAGEPGVRQSWGPRFETYVRNNILATERLLDACRDAAVQRFVFAGSSSVYGDSPDLPWRETTPPQPRSPYAITKLAAEHLCHAYHRSFGVPIVVLRYFTVFGPRQRPDMALHRFLHAAHTGEPIIVFGDGSQRRDFTYVADIVTATVAAASAPVIGETFNVGGGGSIVLNELLDLIAAITKKPLTIERRAPQAGDAPHTWADTSRAAALLGYTPRTSLAEGLEREWSWLRTIGDS
jgi:nucleoside-diphosphate-sugar epimerase